MQLGLPTSRRRSNVTRLALLFGLVCWAGSVAVAEPPIPLDLDDGRSALALGEELERSGQWLDAIQHYDRALKRWPSDDDLKYGRRRARVHFRIERRYSDSSFRAKLLTMTERQALGLFDDLSGRIRNNFVNALSYLSIVAHGTESLYIALANTKFLENNLPAAPRQQDRDARRVGVKSMRRILREKYWNKTIRSAADARQVVAEICQHARRELNMSPAPIVMEYIFGGCNALDDYSGFLTSDRLSDLYSNIDGEFVGLGVEMKAVSKKGMLLVNVLPESPASVGGLRPGDHIVSIGGTDVRDHSIDEAANMLRGPVASRVTLRISRAASDREWNAVLIRRAVQVKSIPKAEIIDQDLSIGYIKLTGFQKSTARELDDALTKLRGQGMKALVLDLRGNPGGLLTAAVEVLDRFMESGVLVSTKGRTTDQNWTYRARRSGTFNIPLALLTDGDSASASEIVAGAIRDHHRGKIVGRQTFGKWSVQSIFNIGTDTGLRLTTAKFYSPDGHTLGKIGVKPDYIVELPKRSSKARFQGTAFVEGEDRDVEKALQVLRKELR
jgi:carboxyl-terminal processing protease